MTQEDLGELVQKLKGQITGIMGRVDGFEETGHHAKIPDYEGLRTVSHEAAESIAKVGRYLAEKGLVSGPPKPNVESVVYRVVHVDDEDTIRDLVRDVLVVGVNPDETKVFDHPGKKVSYTLDSYGSVDEALEAINQDDRPVDILITDREMILGTGFDLFERISNTANKAVRRPEFAHVRNLAMFSGNMEQAELSRAQRYGAIVIQKPMNVVNFEQQIYQSIIRHQS